MPAVQLGLSEPMERSASVSLAVVIVQAVEIFCSLNNRETKRSIREGSFFSFPKCELLLLNEKQISTQVHPLTAEEAMLVKLTFSRDWLTA